MDRFKIVSEYKMMGDQEQAVEKLAAGILEGKQHQTLMGVTGSGKTFTMANIIEKVQRPTLIISHNKTLAAQLHGEFKEFFPENAVEYFVSYYDYYQPEAYVASTDTYIEKDSDINAEIEKLRHSATAALSERKDVIIVASVSCIYGLGSPIDYSSQVLSLRPGMVKERNDILRMLVDIQYARNDMSFERSTFRVRGDTIDIYPAGSESAVRVEMFGDEIADFTEGGFREGATAAAGFENERAAVEEIVAEVLFLLRREREGIMASAVEDRNGLRIGRNLIVRQDHVREVDVEIFGHPFEEVLGIRRIGRPVVAILRGDFGDEHGRPWRIRVP